MDSIVSHAFFSLLSVASSFALSVFGTKGTKYSLVLGMRLGTRLHICFDDIQGLRLERASSGRGGACWYLQSYESIGM